MLFRSRCGRTRGWRVRDRIEHFGVAELDELVALLNRRGVGRTFLVQMAQRLQDPRTPASSPNKTSVHQEWLRAALPDLAAAQAQQPADQAADNLSVSNAIGSLRQIGNADWPEIVSHASVTMQLLLGSPSFEAERDDSRNETLHTIELLARRCRRSETAVAQTLLALMHDPGTRGAASAASHGSSFAEKAKNLVGLASAVRRPSMVGLVGLMSDMAQVIAAGLWLRNRVK